MQQEKKCLHCEKTFFADYKAKKFCDAFCYFKFKGWDTKYLFLRQKKKEKERKAEDFLPLGKR